MRVNTDGVLLGALLTADDPLSILDIGAGTGVIALMLAQRFANAEIGAVEIDEQAAATAAANFANSIFGSRLSSHSGSFEDYFQQHPDRKFDLIVSNPPFFLNSLKSETSAKQKARHADASFFEDLFRLSARHLNENGKLVLILPVGTVAATARFADEAGLHLQTEKSILSFSNSRPHRKIISFGPGQTEVRYSEFIIYADEKVYSAMYAAALKDFFTIF
ncbi:MAG TPA: methyltransferase [Sphingobacteriaceae bacterium]